MIFRLNFTPLDKKYLAVRPYNATPIAADFSKLVVNKPWGNEYLMYSNPSVEIWNLFIGYNKATSMHCHPNKKTILVILDGKANFSSLNESMELSPMDAVIINSGTFHSTQATSKSGAKVLEFETPPMKHDLIRLEDKYGRADSGYEGLEKMMIESSHIRFAVNDIGNTKDFCNSRICVKHINNNNDLITLGDEKNDLMIVTAGAVISKHGDALCGPADILRTEELNDGAGIVCRDLQILTIKTMNR